MSTRKSTGCCQRMMGIASGGGDFKTIFNLGFIRIFSGAIPATADAAETGTLLCIISNNSTGTGLTFDYAVGGVLSKAAAETWSGTNSAGGVATHFRLVPATNTTGLSATEARLQGRIGTGGDVEYIVGDTTFVNGATTTLPSFSESLVPS